jgi:hypothetical protein
MAVLDIEMADHIAVVRLNRPESRNALNPELVVRLAQAWEAIRADPQVRVVMLTGAGDSTFCAGFDLARFIPLISGARQPEDEWDQAVQDSGGLVLAGQATLRDLDLDKPVVVAANGESREMPGQIANSGKICSHPGPFPAGKRTLLGQLDDTLTSCSNVGNRKVGSDSVRAMQTADIFCSESLGERGVPSQQPTNLYVLIKHAPMFSPASPCSCRRRPIVRQWAPCCSHTHNSCPSPGLPPVRGCP